jgi:bifunctional non-homologous end joining protein LigD
MKIGSQNIELSNPDKVLFSQDGITKGDLVEYYRQIAEFMLPYLKDRPLVMNRYPDGIQKPGFVQQSISEYFPDWIDRVDVKKEGGSITHVVCQKTATLVYLANQACVVLHTWLSKQDKLDYPDQLVFDLDPSGEDFDRVREAAGLLRKFLQRFDLDPLVKTTGSRGLHVVLPLNRKAAFAEVHGFAHDVAAAMAGLEPEKVTIEQRKEKRKGRVLLDYMRNSYGQLVVAPYSIRARPGAPVAAPLDWEELSSGKISPQKYTLKNIFQRLARKGDPWESQWGKTYSLDKARKKLNELKPSVAEPSSNEKSRKPS